MRELTVVMYHYVRPIVGSQFPRIKGLEVQAFKRQLDFLEKNYSLVSSEQVIDAVINKKQLPTNSCWLTFDDGYKDHYNYVLPELVEREISGAFFPPRVAIEENKLLDVNSIQHILGCTSSIELLVEKLNEKCLFNGISESQLEFYYKKFGTANRFDDDKTIYFKRMLQHVLPDAIRHSITASLFEELVGRSEVEFSKNLYMNFDDIRELSNNGMYIGSHGSMHYWLNQLTAEKQKKDISDSLTFLEQIGVPTQDWIMCYPYGGYNETTLSLIKELGASIGLTTTPRKANLAEDNPFELPRMDTNDFPQ